MLNKPDTSSFLSSRRKMICERLLLLSLIISPLFLLTVKGWMTQLVVICGLIAIYLKLKAKKHEPVLATNSLAHIGLLSFIFALPILSIFISQSFSGQFEWRYYDSPAHILICVFVMLAIVQIGPRVVEWMSYSFPLGNLLALGEIWLHPNLFWGEARLTTFALDPLAFGSLSLTFGLLSLASISLHRNQSKFWIIYKLIGFCAGLYLSLVSGSRTGWVALPLLGLLWFFYKHAKFNLQLKIAAAASIIVIIVSGYYLSETIQQRTSTAVKEIIEYNWNGSNVQTSVGDRISFARIAFYLLEKKPLAGWGDGNFKSVFEDPDLNFANSSTKMLALNSGFHNEVTANMVRSGIWGLFSSIGLFLIPALYFFKKANHTDHKQRNVALFGLVFLICQIVSSVSMELFNLRYAASFFGLMLATICGQLLYYDMQNTINSKNDNK